MKDARKIVNKLNKIIKFKSKSEEEEIELYFYILYKWAQDRNYDFFVTLKRHNTDMLTIMLFFKSIGGCVFDLDEENTMIMEIEIKGDVDDFKKQIRKALTLCLNKMQELDNKNDDYDDFLGGDIENDFF